MIETLCSVSPGLPVPSGHPRGLPGTEAGPRTDVQRLRVGVFYTSLTFPAGAPEPAC